MARENAFRAGGLIIGSYIMCVGMWALGRVCVCVCMCIYISPYGVRSSMMDERFIYSSIRQRLPLKGTCWMEVWQEAVQKRVFE